METAAYFGGVPKARVQHYLIQERATKRHKWQIVDGYGYTDYRIGRPVKQSGYPLPVGVVNEATDAFIGQLRQAMGTMVSLHHNAAGAKT